MEIGQSGDVVRMVAQNVTRLRTARRLSLSRLAEDSGIGKATLSMLESGRGNPTVETLWSLANALDVSFSELIATVDEPVRVTPLTEMPTVNGGQDIARVVEQVRGAALVEMFHLTFPSGSERHSQPLGEGVLQSLLLIEGRLDVIIGNDRRELAANEKIAFSGNSIHGFRNNRTRTAVAITWISYPRK